MKRVILCLAVAVFTVAVSIPASAGDGAAARKLYPPDAEPFGSDYAEWFGEYMIWLQEIPSPKNPINDPASPLNCSEQRGGKIVFLGPSGADCTVSDDSALALTPAVGFWECSTAEGLGETWAELRTCARENFGRDLDPDIYHQRVVIDGKLLSHQRRWVRASPGEIVDFPTNNIWGADPGPSRSLTKGFFFILRPLEEGPHRIVIHVRDEVIGEFRYVWKLRVKGG